jgi:hypothetical protein
VALLAAGCATTRRPTPVTTAAANVPYQLSLQAFEIPGLPGLHSVVKAIYQNKLVILTGRTNGMHEFPPQRDAGIVQSFPPNYTLAKVLAPDGSLRIGAFGGVFRGGRMEGYVHPVYITPAVPSCGREGGQKLNFVLSEATDSSQWLSQYEGPIVGIYSKRPTSARTPGS